jgi:hypothetical protein
MPETGLEMARTRSFRFIPLPQLRKQQVALYVPRDAESLSDAARFLVDGIRREVSSLATSGQHDRDHPIASDEDSPSDLAEQASSSIVGADKA